MTRKKKILFIGLTLLGLTLAVLSLLLEAHISQKLGGMLMGIGMGLFAFGGSSWRTQHTMENNPEIKHKNEIADRDERNIVIRNQAKARAGDIAQWCVMGIAWVTIGIGAPLWLTLLLIAVFLLYSILALCFMVKYQKEM